MMAEFIEEGSNEVAAEEVQELDQPMQEVQQEEVVQQQEVDEIPENTRARISKKLSGCIVRLRS